MFEQLYYSVIRLKKRIFIKKRIIFLSFIALLIISCSEKDEFSGIISYLPQKEWNYLSDTINLETVSVNLIKTTAQLAGYPQYNKYIEYSIKLYKIIYFTTYKGERIKVSGLISIPLGITDSIPMMIVGNGLILANEDAPSKFNLPSNFTGFEFIAAMGYITLIPDMIGFGESEELLFPFHNAEHSANTMIDLIYAGEEFIKSKNLPVNNNKFLTGYSEGGYVALATLKRIEENPSSDIHITAASVGAGGFNLVSLLDYVFEKNSYPSPCHMALLFCSYNSVYDLGKPLSYFFKYPYNTKIPKLLNGDYNQREINNSLPASLESLFNPEFLIKLKNHSDLELIAAFEENSIDNWAPKTPLRIFHSEFDEIIPFSDSKETYDKMIENGSKSIMFTTTETHGHFESGVEFVEIALNWFDSLNYNP